MSDKRRIFLSDSAVEHEQFIPQICGAHNTGARESLIHRHRIQQLQMLQTFHTE
jgi:hypothetical protein